MATIACVGMCLAVADLKGQALTLGTWLEEGTGSITGSGDTFTATPVDHGIADNGDNFGERNAARHRAYQLFSQGLDFSSAGQTVQITFDVEFADEPVATLDTGFRMSLVDTSTNQGFYAVGFGGGGRNGTYSRTRFVDNLDNPTGDPWGGTFHSAINGSGTIAQASASPTITNGATELGLVANNMVSFDVLFTRDVGDSFSYTTNVSESNGDVVYAETAGSYDPVNPTSGDTSVANIAINSFDGVVFGLFNDKPFEPNSSGSYTVSNFSITGVLKPLLGDFNSDGFVDLADLDQYIGRFLRHRRERSE